MSTGRWRWFWCFLAVTIACALAACSPSEVEEADSAGPDSEVEIEVLHTGVDLIRTNALYAGRLDWQQVEREAERLASQGPSSADVHRFLNGLIADLDDRHSQLVVASAEDVEFDLSLPRGDAAGAVGYLVLPSFNSLSHADRYASAARDVLAQRACGWIVDFRFNRGGNTPSMLAALAPLLEPGPVIGYERRDGSTEMFTFDRQGNLLGPDGAVLVRSGDHPVAAFELPVAVLQYRRTASAAEAALVALRTRDHVRSFGTPTFGVPTGNVAFPLPDGATISLTIGVAVDPDGRRYEGPIDPHEPIPHAPVETRPFDDAAYEAATAWIEEQPACRDQPADEHNSN